MLQHIGLFEGIGGFSLASQAMGWETVAMCEIDNFAQAVLRERFPGVPIFGDVCKLTKSDFDGLIQPNKPIILTGGFPCQPFSHAGARQGTNDDRHLWPEMYRIIKELRPDWVVGENVPGILGIENGMVFEQVCVDLEAENYEVQTFVLPACATGAPHRRDRVWIVAYTNNPGRSSGLGSIQSKNRELSEWNKNSEFGNTNSGAISDTEQKRCEGMFDTNSITEKPEIYKDFGYNGDGIRSEISRCDKFVESGINGNSEHNGLSSEQKLRGNEKASDKWRSKEQEETRKSSRANRPNDATSLHRSNDGSEWFNSDTDKTRHEGSEQQKPQWTPPPTSQFYPEYNWSDWPSVSPFHSGYDGLSDELVRHIRTSLAEAGETPERIEAYLRKEANYIRKNGIACSGNAVVPQLVYRIFQSILFSVAKTKHNTLL